MTQHLAREHFAAMCEAQWSRGVDVEYPIDQDNYEDVAGADLEVTPHANFINFGSARQMGASCVMLRRQTMRLYEGLGSGELSHASRVVVVGQAKDGNSCAALGLLALKMCDAGPTVFQCAPQFANAVPKSFLIDDGRVTSLYPETTDRELYQLSKRKGLWIICDQYPPHAKLKNLQGKFIQVTSGRCVGDNFMNSHNAKYIHMGGWGFHELMALKAQASGGNRAYTNAERSILRDIYRDFVTSPKFFVDLPDDAAAWGEIHDSLAQSIGKSIQEQLEKRPTLLKDLIGSQDVDGAPGDIVEMVPVYDTGYHAINCERLIPDRHHKVQVSTRIKLQPRTKHIALTMITQLRNWKYEEYEGWMGLVNEKRWTSMCAFEWQVMFEELSQQAFSPGSMLQWQEYSSNSGSPGNDLLVEIPTDLETVRVGTRLGLSQAITTNANKPCYILPASRHQESLHGVLLLPELKQCVAVIVTYAIDYTISDDMVKLLAQALPDEHELSVTVISPPHKKRLLRMRGETQNNYNVQIHVWNPALTDLLTHARQQQIAL